MENTMAFSIKKRLKSTQAALDGFPWKLATILYTLSWGWPLLRPNTLYWDDWAYIYGRPKSYLNEIFVNTGLPPWRALIDQELLTFGYWTIRWLTFAMFLATGIFLFEILKKVPIFSAKQKSYIVLLFLVIPANHARIALVMFGYTTSYFLFFLGWMLLIRRSTWSHFLTASLCFFWCFMTHSFLFFLALPIAHSVFLNRNRLKRSHLDVKILARISILTLSPIIYVFLRSQLWQPTEKYQNYHSFHWYGLLLGIVYFLPGALLFFLMQIFGNKKRDTTKIKQLILGFIILGLGLLPYCISNNADRYSLMVWRPEWASRHQLLMPLGMALILVGTFSLFEKLELQKLVFMASTIFMISNAYWGAQYYLDSLKKEQLIELVKQELNFENISQIEFVDNARNFNFRGGKYRGTEVQGLFSIAFQDVDRSVDVTSCLAAKDAEVFSLNAKNSFVRALITAEVGLYVKLNPCKSK